MDIIADKSMFTLLYFTLPGEEVDVEEDVLSVVKVEFISGDHDFTHGVRRRTQHHDCIHTTPTTRLTSTQPCIPPGSLNRVPALMGSGKGGNVSPGLCVIPYVASEFP